MKQVSDFKLLGGIMPERQKVNDRNAQRATLSEQPNTVQQGDTFARTQGSVFGDTRVSSGVNDALQAIGKFGTQIGAAQIKKEAQADFVSGQALRAAGGELTGKERPPSRQGYKALDAKLKTQEWHQAQLLAIDNGENDIDPLDYSQSLGNKFQELLTGDAETDAILTASMGELAGNLGRYHAAANTKKRTADGITQATSDVRNHLLAIAQAKDTGDVDGESAARGSLLSALQLPTVTNPEVKQKLASDLSVMGLELGDPSVLNYVRENDIALTPQQERQVGAAKAAFNKAEGRKLDIKFQNDTADFEAQGNNAKSTEEFRELRDTYAAKHPGKVTDKYLIAQEKAFRTTLAKGAIQKLGTDMYSQGKIGQWNGTPKQVQATIEASKAAILGDPSLDPDDAQNMVRTNWSKNGVIDDSLKKELQSGLSVPLLNGELHPNFKPAFDKVNEYHKHSPDLALKHLNEDQRKLFLNVKTATESGGQTVGDAVSTLEVNRVNQKDLTREEREDYTDAIAEATDNVLGKGFFNWEHGVTTSLNNTAEISTRVKNLADLYMAQGYTDPESAVEAARIKILETHEQLGDALVFNDGKPFHDRMGVAPDRTEDVMDFMYDQLTLADIGVNREDTVLLGNPKEDTLLIGVKDENGVLQRTIVAHTASVGKEFNVQVVQPEHQAYLDQEAAAIQNTEDKLALRQEAIDSGIYTPETADAALGNIIGSTVLEQRTIAAREDKADLDTMEKYGIESEEELEQFKVAQFAFAPGNTLTKEQINLLQDGDTEGYLKTLQEPTVQTDATQATRNVQVSTESPDAFIKSVAPTVAKTLKGSGIHPEVAIAMSALESGWGKHVKGDNYFGIKGKGQEFVTHEVIDGKRIKITDSFKEFSGYQGAVEGLKEFLTTNPRYSKALAAGTPEEQAKALQAAGYATDPKYADKLISIMKRI